MDQNNTIYIVPVDHKDMSVSHHIQYIYIVPDLNQERPYASSLVRPLPIPCSHDFKENY